VERPRDTSCNVEGRKAFRENQLQTEEKRWKRNREVGRSTVGTAKLYIADGGKHQKGKDYKKGCGGKEYLLENNWKERREPRIPHESHEIWILILTKQEEEKGGTLTGEKKE